MAGALQFVPFYSLISPDKEKMFSSTMSDSSYYYGQDAATVSSTTKSAAEPQEELVLYIPEMEEIRISPIVARKGFLNILEQKSNGWKKRWVVSTREERAVL